MVTVTASGNTALRMDRFNFDRLTDADSVIVQGTNDTVVPPSQSRALQHALEANHVPVHYLSYPGGHEFSDITPAQRAELILQEWAFVEGTIGQ